MLKNFILILFAFNFLLITTVKAQVPTITSFTPLTGVVGTTVTITGTNFNTTAASNIVFFGATRATVSAATATELTVTVPSGATYGAITVLNTANSLASFSLLYFTPIFSPATISIRSAYFATSSNYNTGNTFPNSAAIGDFDGDGKSDLVITRGTIASIFLNNSSSGNVNFASKVDVTVSNSTTFNCIKVGDINGDGKPDLVVVNQVSNTVTVLRNTSTGIGNVSFATQAVFTTGAQPNSVAIGDIDGDGKPDLAIANIGPATNSVSILRNTGTSSSINFANKVDLFTSAGYSVAVALGDLDGDGKVDLAVSNTGSVATFRNTSTSGNITFATRADYAITAGNSGLAIGDVDGNGKLDLVVAGTTLYVLPNTSTSGTISFATTVSFTGLVNTGAVSFSDINGDGKPELVLSGGTAFCIYPNISNVGTINTSSFATRVDVNTTTNNFLAIGDLDGDGKPDFAFNNYVSVGLASVLRNSCMYWTGAISDAWNLGDNWSTGVVPNASENIIVPSSASIQPVISATAVCNSLEIASGASLSINGSNSLTIGMDLINAGALTANASTINIGTNFTNSGTFTAGTGTVNYNGSVAQTAAVVTYNNLTLSGALAKTFASTPMVNGIFSLEGTATINVAPTYGTNATLQYNISSARTDWVEWITPFLATGGVIIKGTGTFTINAAKVFGNNTNVPLTINSGVTLLTNNIGLTFHGDLINSGIITAGSSQVVITGTSASQNIGAFTTTGLVSMTKTSGTATLTGNVNGGAFTMSGLGGTLNLGTGLTHSFTGTWTRTNGTIDAGSSTLNLSGSISGTTGTFTAGTGTVNYKGSVAQTAAVLTYNNLTLSGTSAKTFATTPTVNGILSLEGTATITVTSGVVRYGSNATLQFNKPAAYTATSKEWVTPFAGSGGVVIKNSGTITFNSAKVINKLFIESGAMVNLGTFSSWTNDLFFIGASQSDDIYGGTGSILATRTEPTYFAAATGDLQKNTNNKGLASLTTTAGTLSPVFSPAITAYTTTPNVWNNILSTTVTASVYDATSTIEISINGGSYVSVSSGSASLPLSLNPGSNTINVRVTATDATTQLTTLTIIREIPPVITSFSPIMGVVGTTVTITGTGFNTTAANNIVFFGATRATVSTATATSLSVIVPSGATYAPITLLNTGNTLATYSLSNFNPIFTPSLPKITSNSFNTKIDFTTGTTSCYVAIGDLNGDGKPDLAVVNQGSNNVSVLRNTGSSGTVSFASKVDFATGGTPTSVAIGDIDGDGKPDLVTANNLYFGTVSILRNTIVNGTIDINSFATKADFTTGSYAYSVAIGDIDGDGKLDVATANYTATGTISVLRNTGSIGNINFAANIDFAAGTSPYALVIGDLNGDGKPDLATANYTGSGKVSVLCNTGSTGTISFANLVDFVTGINSSSLAIGDIDGDSKPDLAVANFNSSTVAVLRNTTSNGTVNFAGKVDFATQTYPTSVVIGDIDGDGKADLAVVSNSNVVSVYTNKSNSGIIDINSFATRVDLATALPGYLAIGDLDGDGKPDLAGAASSLVSVLRNATNMWTGAVSREWHLGGNWSSGIVPTISDYVIVPSSASNQPILSTAAAFCNILDIASGASVTINGSYGLTIGTNLINSGTLTGDANTITIGGNLTNSGTLAANASTINIGANFTNSGTFTAGTGTVNYNGSVAQTAAVVTYNNLNLSGTLAKTFATTPTVNGILSLEGTATITVTSGVVTYGANATLQYNKPAAYTATSVEWITPFLGSGGVIIKGTGAIGVNSAKVFGNSTNVPLTINSGATLVTNNNGLTFHGDFINSGIFTAGSSPIEIAGTMASQSIAGFTTTGAVSMTKTSGTATLTGNVNGGAFTMSGLGGTLNLGTSLIHSFTGTWTRTNGTINASSSTLNLSGSISGTTGTFTAGTGTVNYNGSGAQTAAVLTYNNLTLSGTSAKIFATTPTVNGILSLEGTATITVTSGVVTYGTNATLQYNTTTARSAGLEWISPFVSNGGVVIKNTGTITLNAAKTVNKISIATSASVNLSTFTSSTQFLLLGSANKLNGSYGGTSSAATNKDATYFPGTATGIINVSHNPTWAGTISIDWHTAGNWVDNVVPISTDIVTIPSGTPFQPTIGGAAVCGTLDIAVGASLSINGSNTLTIGSNLINAGTITANAGTINIGGNYTNTGTFTAGTGTVIFNGVTQAVTGATTFNNVTFSSTTSTTIVSGTTITTSGAGIVSSATSLIVTGAIITNGTFTLKSDATGTASIGNSAGTITGNVIVERYIPAKRAWRFIGAPLKNSNNNSIFYNWQNNGSAIANYGVELWAPVGTSAPSSSNSGMAYYPGGTSIKAYNSASNVWDFTTNTNTSTLFDATTNKAYCVFVTGPFTTDGSGNINTGSSATTLSATGTLIQGTHTKTLTPTASGQYFLVANPYASSVSPASITLSINIANNFYMWDPNCAGTYNAGQYVAYSRSANTYTLVGTGSGTVFVSGTTPIQSGQAFFVSVGNANTATITFNESNKVSGSTNVFRTSSTDVQIMRHTLKKNINGVLTNIDGALGIFYNGGNAAVDFNDAVKFSNSTENIVLRRANASYAIEERPSITDKDTLFVRLTNTQQSAYTLELTGENFTNTLGLTATLKDAYTNTSLPLSITDTNRYNFTVDANTASTGDRFVIVFKTNEVDATLPVQFTHINATQKGAAVQVDWKVATEQNIKQYVVEKSTNGSNFTTIATQAANNINNSSYTAIDNSPITGSNYYRVLSTDNNGKQQYSNVAVVKIGGKQSSISVYPNPVINNTMNLQLENIAKGNYTIQLVNTQGSVVMQTKLQHAGGSGTQSIDLPSTLSSGNYVLKAVDEKGVVFTEKVVLSSKF